MCPDQQPIHVVVCHYNRGDLLHIRHMALHAVAFLCAGRPEDVSVLLVDGSPCPDDELAGGLEALGAAYLHCGRELTFGETYNAGIRRTNSPVVVTMANDILIRAEQVRMLAREVTDGVGCAMPYLTSSDYGAQRARRLPVPRRCFPTRMTLNVNAFSRRALEQVGLIPEQMSGCYNDVILAVRLHEEGYRVVLRNVGRVVHLGQQTLSTGDTCVSLESDAARFAEQFPRYWQRGRVLFHKVAQSRPVRAAYWALEALPADVVSRLGLWNVVWALEPYLCAERGTFAEGVARVLGRSGRAVSRQSTDAMVDGETDVLGTK